MYSPCFGFFRFTSEKSLNPVQDSTAEGSTTGDAGFYCKGASVTAGRKHPAVGLTRLGYH